MEIVVHANKNTFTAFLKENPSIQGYGNSKRGAIGDLIVNAKEQLGFKLTDWETSLVEYPITDLEIQINRRI